jgi:hypothetical protein
MHHTPPSNSEPSGKQAGTADRSQPQEQKRQRMMQHPNHTRTASATSVSVSNPGSMGAEYPRPGMFQAKSASTSNLPRNVRVVR